LPPEQENLAEKVRALSKSELEAIRLPENRSELVLSIAAIADAKAGEAAAPKTEPWLRVFADGRIDCANPEIASDKRHEDTLTQDELVWLLHLAVNECQILRRSTQGIADDIAKSGDRGPPKEEPNVNYEYHVKLPSGENDLSIPSRVLILRPLRGQLKLHNFGRLQPYAHWLAYRANLGKPKDRQQLLNQLNGTMLAEHPDLPLFRMEHLSGAASVKTKLGDSSSAVFVQELPVGNNKYKKVTGMILTPPQGDKPLFKVSTMEFSKYRP
jgi:hypothetical protein